MIEYLTGSYELPRWSIICITVGWFYCGMRWERMGRTP